MIFSKFLAAFAIVPLVSFSNPALETAQNSNRFQNWIYLYEDTFENAAREQITQQWWLEPNPERQNTMVEFSLLARRNPISENGTAAAVFSYVADCGTLSYAIEEIEFLDSSDGVIDIQTHRGLMEPADPETDFYQVLNNICNNAY